MSGISQQNSAINTPLNFGLAIFGPFSSVPGSATIFYLQPLLTGKVFASAGILIGAQLFLFIAQHLFGLKGVPLFCPGINTEDQFIKIPIPELQELLRTLSKFSPIGNETALTNLMPQGYSANSSDLTQGDFLTTQTPEAPLVVALAVYGDYSNKPHSPVIFVAVPIFSLPGVRGGIPLLILGTLGTILVRSVVPPGFTGANPF